jgi:hypothetical protein
MAKRDISRSDQTLTPEEKSRTRRLRPAPRQGRETRADRASSLRLLAGTRIILRMKAANWQTNLTD